MIIPARLSKHIECNIIPLYDSFDMAHRRSHAMTVIEQSMLLAQHYDVDMAMVYTVAAYHDTGLSKGRERHHTASAEIVRSDACLREFFTAEQIEVMADAVEDHRASNKQPPRSIYGRIVAEADRLIESETIITRTIQYGMAHYPALTKEKHIERAVTHIKEKYGRKGYLRLWIPESPNAARLEEFRQLIEDEQRLLENIARVYTKEHSGSVPSDTQ